MERGERIPIELGTKQTSAALTSSLARQYSEIGLAPIWGLIDNSHELVDETQTFHLKRLLLHASKGNELLVFSLNGKNVTKSFVFQLASGISVGTAKHVNRRLSKNHGTVSFSISSRWFWLFLAVSKCALAGKQKASLYTRGPLVVAFCFSVVL